MIFEYSEILQYHWLCKVKQQFIADWQRGFYDPCLASAATKQTAQWQNRYDGDDEGDDERKRMRKRRRRYRFRDQDPIGPILRSDRDASRSRIGLAEGGSGDDDDDDGAAVASTYCPVDRDASHSVGKLLLHHYKSDLAHTSDSYSLVIGLYKSGILAKNNWKRMTSSEPTKFVQF